MEKQQEKMNRQLPKNFFKPIWMISFLFIILLATACESAATPPPPMVIISTPAASIIIKDAYITIKDGKDKVLPAVFASGVEQLDLTVEFDSIPEGTNVNIEVSDKNGKVELGTSFIGFLTKGNSTTLFTTLHPKSGSFADGLYQATVHINDIPTIQLNWRVGE